MQKLIPSRIFFLELCYLSRQLAHDSILPHINVLDIVNILHLFRRSSLLKYCSEWYLGYIQHMFLSKLYLIFNYQKIIKSILHRNILGWNVLHSVLIWQWFNRVVNQRKIFALSNCQTWKRLLVFKRLIYSLKGLWYLSLIILLC